MSRWPTYAELLERDDGPPGSAWGVFGRDDELGTLNHLTPDAVREATSLVTSGEVINLDLPLDVFQESLIPTRKPVRHTLFASNPFHRDEFLDSFYTQAGSQLDGLRHIGHPEFGFYNGADPERFTAGEPFLGINRYAEHGVVGRGVLLDVDRHLRLQGTPLDHAEGEAIPISVAAETANAQGVELRPGDILMIRTGWVHYHLRERDAEQRKHDVRALRSTGLEPSHETVAWLWDNRFSVVGVDNVAVEVWPARPESPFLTGAERRGDEPLTGHSGLMHRVLIPLLGMALGELWALDELAERCAADGRWDCMIVAKPLNLTGGAGSPLNAVAIR
jgi:kynurenine formamidase